MTGLECHLCEARGDDVELFFQIKGDPAPEDIVEGMPARLICRECLEA